MPFFCRGAIFAHTVVELGLVAFGQQFVDFLLERFDFLELVEDQILLVFGLGRFFIQEVGLTVAQCGFAFFDVNRLERKQLVAVPLVNDDVGIEALSSALK